MCSRGDQNAKNKKKQQSQIRPVGSYNPTGREKPGELETSKRSKKLELKLEA